MGLAPAQRPELHHADEAREVVDLALEVLAVAHAGQVEELCSLVDLAPEAVLERLLGLLQRLGVPEAVQVREHAHDLGEAVDLQEVEELERLHLEAKAAVHQQQHEVGVLGGVNHAAEVRRALDKRQAPRLARDERHGALDLAHVLAGVVLDQRLDERGLAHARRALHQHRERRRLLPRPVRHRHVQAALVALRRARHLDLGLAPRGKHKGLGVLLARLLIAAPPLHALLLLPLGRLQSLAPALLLAVRLAALRHGAARRPSGGGLPLRRRLLSLRGPGRCTVALHSLND